MTRLGQTFTAFALGMTLHSTAAAQCEGTWENQRLTETLDTLAAEVAALNDEGISAGLKAVDRGLPCLEEVVDPRALARYARIQGYLAFADQDEENAVMWLFFAREVDDAAPWPMELPEGHPLLSLLDMWEPPPSQTSQGVLLPPERGAVFVNGTLRLEPSATAEQRNFVQVVDRAAWPKDNFWIDGAQFPPDLLADDGEAPDAPRFYNPTTGAVKRGAAPIKEKQPREPIQIPVVPVALTGGLALASGISYALAGSAQNSLATATTADELTRARSSANLLVLISGATAAGAVGVGVGGVLLHGNGVQFHFRF